MSGDTVTITVPKRWLYAAAGLAIGFAAGWGVAVGWAPGAEPVAADTVVGDGGAVAGDRVEIDVAGRPTLGSPDAPVTMVEFTDYQCPYCGRYSRETKGVLLEEYGDRLRYVVLNFPLRNIHPEAQKAAEAAECARDQDAFLEYARLLYGNQSALGPAQLEAYASDLGLNTTRFEECLRSGVKADRVAADVREGRRHGVRSTPTFFINGRRLLGAQPLETFRAAVDAALAAAEAG